MLLLADVVPYFRHFLLKQTQLKSVTLGYVTLDVIDTVKVLKCYSGIAT